MTFKSTLLAAALAPRVKAEMAALNERLAANDERSYLELFAATEGAQATGRRMFAALSPGPTTIEGGALRIGDAGGFVET